MSDFLSSVIQASGPIERQVTINGQTGPMFFRYLNGQQRLQLTKGKKYHVKQGESPTIEIDLAENEAEKQKLILFCVVDASGKSFFKDLAAVGALPSHVIDAVSKAAEAVNKEAFGSEGETPGES